MNAVAQRSPFGDDPVSTTPVTGAKSPFGDDPVQPSAQPARKLSSIEKRNAAIEKAAPGVNFDTLQVSGGPLLPMGQFIPTAVGVGVEKLGEHVGLPWWVSMPAGILAGGLASGSGSIIQRLKALPPEERKQAFDKAATKLPWGIGKLREAWNELFPGPHPYEPTRPNPAIAAKMKFGGPAEQQFSPPNRLTPRKPGWTAPEPEAPTPFPKGKGTNTKYGGPTEPEYSGSSGPVKRIFGKPARELGRMSPEAPPEPVVPKAPSGTSGTSGTSTARYKTTEPQPQAGFSSRELNPGKVINTQAEAKNLAFAERFKSVGMTPERIQNMTESEYEQYRLALNAERKAAGLSQFEKPRPGVNRRSFAELKADIIRAMKGTQ
jgi:hypothetical protein